MFVSSFKNGNDDSKRNSFNVFYMPLVEIKDFSALINNKPFFYQPVKSKQEAYVKLIEMWRNNDYEAGSLLDYLYHQKNCKTHWYWFIKTNKCQYSSTN